MAGILRHFPEAYGVSVDSRGWASLDSLLSGLRSRYPWVKEWHVKAIALLDPKGRYEVKGNYIRARYGHSLPVEVEPISLDHPQILYHGTRFDRLSGIMERGILRMARRKVHLSSSPEEALEVAKRHGGEPVVLEVDTLCVEERGYKVVRASKTVYTTDYVPPECIRWVIRSGGWLARHRS
jgi:putative RNA 2'-phosphotransferase